MARAAPLQIGMADIARLAKVQRPVVSMWRKRTAGTDHPFPVPLTSGHGPDMFDAYDVARWLVTTGHGNNPDAVEDVAAFATTPDTSPRDERRYFDALTALLCLRAMTMRMLTGLSRDALLDLADAHDPDDGYLYAELLAAGDQLESLAQYSDQLADAAFSPRDALERLMADRFRFDLLEHASTAISKPALALAAKIAVDLTDRAEAPATYVDPTPGSSDLLVAVLAEHGDRSPVEVVTAQGDEPNVRLVRRRVRVHDVYREGIKVDADGTFETSRAVTHVAQFPTPATPAMSEAAVLSAVENIVLQLGDSQRGVVIAPARALSDAPTDRRADRIRDEILRAGHVHAIIRLPRGLVPARPRQSLALWVIGAANHSTAVADRFTMVADLANVALTDDVIDSLLTDLSVATGGTVVERSHTFRFARAVPTRTLLATQGSLVEAGTAPRLPARGDPAELLVRILQTRADIDGLGSSPLMLPEMVPADTPAPMGSPQATIGGMLQARRLRALPGHRLDDGDIASGEGVQVIGVPELVDGSPLGKRTIDRLVLALKYDAARLTEPGDIVFCSSPRPAALIDRVGSSVVTYPARVLRIDSKDPGGLVADVVADDINAAPPRAREWRLWHVRQVGDDQRRLLAAVYEELRHAREEALERLASLERLRKLITDGVSSGALTLQATDDRRKGS